MEQEFNIAAILEDKPKGTKLWSPIMGNCELKEVSKNSLDRQPIIVYNKVSGNDYFLNSGKIHPDGCICLFPSKQMQDWSKFAWKKGDVLDSTNIAVIFDRWTNNDYTEFKAAFVYNQGIEYDKGTNYHTLEFDKVPNDVAQEFIKDVETHFGGKLNLQTLEIKKSEPQFKDGDILVLDKRRIFAKIILILKESSNNIYSTHVFYNVDNQSVNINNILADKRSPRFATDSEKQQLFDTLAKEGKRWNAETKTLEDLPKKCEFKAFDKVVVRHGNDCYWGIDIFSNYGDEYHDEYQCLTDAYEQCLPYNEKTAHLLGTTDDYEK